MQDPDLPSPRYHNLLFVQTNAEGPGSGTKHQVTGDIVTGMYYESVPCADPETTESVHAKTLLGYTQASTYPEQWESVLRSIPPPPKQKAFNITTMKMEPVKLWDPLTFYAAGESRRSLEKCTEWTEQKAIPALVGRELIVSHTS